MSGRYLLDTNVVIALFAKDASIHERLAHAEEVFIPSIAVGEMYFGAYKSSKVSENLERIESFVLGNTVLSCTAETAKKYGAIKTRLREKGQPIPENDIWIAAIAQQFDITLVSRDMHFNAISELKIETWL